MVEASPDQLPVEGVEEVGKRRLRLHGFLLADALGHPKAGLQEVVLLLEEKIAVGEFLHLKVVAV